MAIGGNNIMALVLVLYSVLSITLHLRGWGNDGHILSRMSIYFFFFYSVTVFLPRLANNSHCALRNCGHSKAKKKEEEV